MLPEKRW